MLSAYSVPGIYKGIAQSLLNTVSWRSRVERISKYMKNKTNRIMRYVGAMKDINSLRIR